MVAASCPSREVLRQYSIGMLSDDQSADLAGHLDSCPECQATILTLEDAEDTLVRRLRMPLGSESCLAEPEFQAALAEAIGIRNSEGGIRNSRLRPRAGSPALASTSFCLLSPEFPLLVPTPIPCPLVVDPVARGIRRQHVVIRGGVLLVLPAGGRAPQGDRV